MSADKELSLPFTDLDRKLEQRSKGGIWDAVDAAARRSADEVARTQGEVERHKGWRFAGVRDGWQWRARHREHGLVCAPSSGDLLAAVQLFVRRDAEAAEAIAQAATGARR